MRCRTLLVLGCLVMFVQASVGDEVFFKNGDRLTGKIDHMVGGKLIFKSSLAGDVTINLSDIQTLSSDDAIVVILKDNTGFKQKVLSGQPGRFGVAGTESMRAQEFAIDDIASINPPPKPIPKWTGSLSAGLTSTHGNTKTETISASASMSKRTEKDRTQISADYAKGKLRG